MLITVPAINGHWLRMLVIAKLKGSTRVADAIERLQTVDRLVHQNYVVRGRDGRRRVDVVDDAEAERLQAV